MRLTLKHQILLAPAVVLCLMTLLLGFLQFTYWDLSVQRDRARELKNAFIVMAEADLAAQRMHALARLMIWAHEFDASQIEQLTESYHYLEQASIRLLGSDLVNK